MKQKVKLIVNIVEVLVLAVIASLLIIWTVQKPRMARSQNLAVFIAGSTQNDADNSMLAEGVLSAVIDFNQNYGAGVKVNICEGGYDFEQWEEKFKSLCENNSYDLILTSGRKAGNIAESLSAEFPKQKFIVFDGISQDNPNILVIPLEHWKADSYIREGQQKKVAYDTTSDFLKRKIKF